MSFDFGGFGSGGSDPRLAQAREALTARDFERAIHIAADILADDPMDADARIITDTAQEKIEAEPFVRQFLRKAEDGLASGNSALARTQLEKARSLDGDHPDVLALDAALRSRDSQPAGFTPDAPAAPTPSFVIDAAPQTGGRGAAQASDFGFKFEQAEPAQPEFASFSFDTTAPEPPAPSAPAFSFGAPEEPAQPEPEPSPAPPSFSFGAPEEPAAPASPAPTDLSDFSFDAPAPAPPPVTPAPPAASGFSFGESAGGPREFDFSTLSQSSPEDQKKIQQYLDEGDRAAEASEYQKAIDLWSRIFLIDVTNEAASERIERAKGKRREVEQSVDALLGNAVHAYDRKDYAAARTQLESILRIDPANTTAHDYLGRIPAAGEMPPPRSAAPAPPTAVELDLIEDEPRRSTYEEPSMAPGQDEFDEMPSTGPRRDTKKAAAPAPRKKSPLPMLGAIVFGLAVLLAGGWFAWSKYQSKESIDPALTQAIFTRATNLAQGGRYDDAIAALQEIKPDDPQRDRALSMIADFQTKRTRAAQTIDGKPASEFYADNLEVALASFAAHDYVTAKKSFEQAMRVKALPPEIKASYAAAAQQVAKLDAAKALFAERKYQDAIANLESLYAQDAENKNVQRLLIDAHFNLGANALREERLPEAIKEFDQVLAMDPSDELAKRSKDLAARYDGEQKDLLFKVYVKYVPMRQAI